MKIKYDHFTTVRSVRNKIISMKQSHPIEEFRFPMEIINYKFIKNCENFYKKIKQDSAPLKRQLGFEPTIITDSEGGQTLTIQCKQCESYFKYYRSPNGEQFSIRQYNNHHNHVLRQSHSPQQSIIQRIEKFLQQDIGRSGKYELEADILSTYRISPNQFEQLYSQAVERLKRNTLLYDGRQIDELVKKLKIQRFNIQADLMTSKIDREPRTITKSILITNDQMAVNYRKYCQTCFLAIDDKRTINRWYIGAILGLDRNMEMTLFGLFLMKTVDEEHLAGVLKKFFSLNQFKPETIITQSDYYYEKTLKELKEQNLLNAEQIYDYSIMLEKFHRNNLSLKKIITGLIKEPQPAKFFNTLQLLYNSINFQEFGLDLQDFVSQADKICLSQIEPLPVGPYRAIKNKGTTRKIEYSPIKAFFKVIYEKECQVGKHLYSKVKNMLALLLEPEEDTCAESNRIMKHVFPALDKIRQQVTLNVMDDLIKKVYFGVQYREKKIDEETSHVFEGRMGKFIVTKKNEKWVCECQESSKTMLPCVHELLVCCKRGEQLNHQVGKRWTNEDERLQEQMKRRMHRKTRNKKQTLVQFLA